MRFVDLPHAIYNDASVSASRRRRLSIQAYDYVDIWVQVVALNGSPTLASFDVRLEHKIPREGGQWLDAGGKSISPVTEASPLPSTQVISLAPADVKSEDISLAIDVTFAGGVSPSWSVNLYYQGRAS